MAIQFFENTEYTSILGTMGSIENTTGIVRFTTNNLNLIFQRKLIAFSAFSNWNAAIGDENKIFQYMDVRFNLAEPLNTTQQFTLNPPTIPPGGVFQQFTNFIILRGNTPTVSIFPIPIKVFNLTMNCHDVLAANKQMACYLTLFWETKKRAKFVGED